MRSVRSRSCPSGYRGSQDASFGHNICICMISILKYDEVQQMNEHGSARISGLIPYDKRDEYLKMAAKETWVKILGYDEEEKETILFYGKDTVRLLARIGLANMRFTCGYRLLPK